jgi:hypothetical protein
MHCHLPLSATRPVYVAARQRLAGSRPLKQRPSVLSTISRPKRSSLGRVFPLLRAALGSYTLFLTV